VGGHRACPLGSHRLRSQQLLELLEQEVEKGHLRSHKGGEREERREGVVGACMRETR